MRAKSGISAFLLLLLPSPQSGTLASARGSARRTPEICCNVNVPEVLKGDKERALVYSPDEKTFACGFFFFWWWWFFLSHIVRLTIICRSQTKPPTSCHVKRSGHLGSHISAVSAVPKPTNLRTIKSLLRRCETKCCSGANSDL